MTQLHQSSFDEKKASEVAFFFLAKAANQGMHITKLRLVKWMYLAERQSYLQFGEPLTGDRLFSMQHGPVVSATLSLMERAASCSGTDEPWKAVVTIQKGENSGREKQHQYAALASSCPYKSEDDLLTLSDSEVDLLEGVWRKYWRKSAKQLETLLHDPKEFSEWQWKNGDGSNPIELEELLRVLGYNGEQAGFMIKKIASMQSIGQVFAH